MGRGGVPDVVHHRVAGLGDPPVESQKGIGAAVDSGQGGQQPQKDPHGPLSRVGGVGVPGEGGELHGLDLMAGGRGSGDLGAAGET